MSDRLEVLKTYKTYVGGKFPRSESNRIYRIENPGGKHIANACRCTRKDVRDAVVVARSAFDGWSGRSAYNRGQILYRIAEMLEGRKDQFVNELELLGAKKKNAQKEIEISIDRLIYYAGWTDKISQVFGTVNPVASSHFNFSMPEPTGVVGIIGPDESPLLSIVSLVAPVIACGNSCIILASTENPLSAVSFGEVLHASDVPAGVVNILTGNRDEMVNHLTTHMDVNAIFNAINDSETKKQLDENASISVKRVKHYSQSDWSEEKHENPYLILDFMETKTTWHPVGA
ncbi:aldehyde dehydrogenase family protein [Rhodohalobacter sulfatireducens]|uniref:Aldehyde dehydrogenase family protein n=1 Tax=Rhodohalobacter sulfatireducens TaxID=2911366 RepID=A0ABS9KIG1_9BACT|nr:aldehyde dehydrogenase family protein [Rhodohalobacter sulfatireducens]MCG2590633.1 aldehyde dehydrogenase family protein [Rhodohalobacter sulfatireducens]